MGWCCLGTPPEDNTASGSGQSGNTGGTNGTTSSTPFSFSSENTEEFPKGVVLPVPQLRIFTFSELKSATRNFRSDTILGEGGFGKVYKGWVDEKNMNPIKSRNVMVVAVKKLNPESMQGLEEWESEVKFLGRLRHPNLVKLLGYCMEGEELLLVYEFMAKGNLESHLFRRSTTHEHLSWSRRLHIALGAARGLAFLHASEKQIIYRDFKASNILLDENYNGKLSDFGLAKHGPQPGNSHVTTRVMGTLGYVAPEYVATGHLYVKSDVYGFGVVLLEILSGEPAIGANRSRVKPNLLSWAKPLLGDGKKVRQLMDPRLEGQYPLKGARRAAELTLKCLATEPKDRPSMDKVIEILEQIKAIPDDDYKRKPISKMHR